MTPTAQVLPFPRTRILRHVTLLTLDGRPAFQAGFFPGDPGAPWAWICEVVARECSCSENDVHALEGDEESDFADLITADGIPAYRAVIGRC
jgi:hypothetical protein